MGSTPSGYAYAPADEVGSYRFPLKEKLAGSIPVWSIMNTKFITFAGGNVRYTSTNDALNGKTLQECIDNLTKLAEGLNNPVCYISEDGDLVEFTEIKEVANGN